MPPAISPHSSIIVSISERHSRFCKLRVEMYRNQYVVGYYNGLLAADWLQNQPAALRCPTADCASPASKLSPDHISTCGVLRNSAGFPNKAAAGRGETRARHG